MIILKKKILAITAGLLTAMALTACGINDQRIKSGHVIYVIKIGALDSGLIHFAHHSISPDVFDGFELPDCGNTQCI